MNVKDRQVLREKIESDNDFIYCPRLNNSLAILLEKYPDGIEDDRIMKVLLMSEEELQEVYKSAIDKLKKQILDK